MIFYQRKLKKPIVGNCILTGEKRISKAMPSFQKFRILKELNNLAYTNSRGEVHFIVELEKGIAFRDKIISDLFQKKAKISFSQIEKFFPNENDFSHFNLDSLDRDNLKANKTALVLRKIFSEWDKWSFDIQDRFVELLEGEDEEGDFIKDNEEVLKSLEEFSQNNQLNLSREQLKNCLKKVSELPQGHGKYSKKAIQKIMPFLERGRAGIQCGVFSWL